MAFQNLRGFLIIFQDFFYHQEMQCLNSLCSVSQRVMNGFRKDTCLYFITSSINACHEPLPAGAPTLPVIAQKSCVHARRSLSTVGGGTRVSAPTVERDRRPFEWPINPPLYCPPPIHLHSPPPRRNGVRSHSRCGTVMN